MREVNANEVHHLLPYLRRGMLMGDIKYRDQEGTVRLEKEHDQRLQAAGLRKGYGGSRNLPLDYRVDVIARDTIGSMPHIAANQLNVDG